MPLTGKTLDERWLEFVRLTTPIVEKHPSFWSVRQQFYKLQFEQLGRVDVVEKLKDLMRTVLLRKSSHIPPGEFDVVFWLHSLREPEVEAILPLWQYCHRLKLRTIVVAPPRVAGALPLPPTNVLPFYVPHRRGDPDKWKHAYTDLLTLFPEMIVSAAKDLLSSLGRQEDSYEHEIERIFLSLRPKLLVLPVDQFMPGSSACAVARNMGIRSLVLLHGAVSAYNAPVTADRMAVWGEVSWEQMHNLGVEKERLQIFGSPRHDDPPYLSDTSAKQRLAQALACDSKPCLTFFSNGNDLYRNTKEAVVGCSQWLTAAEDRLGSRFNFLVRLHPNEDGSLYTECRNLRVFKNECDLGTSLAGSDIVAALCSTALVEGVLYGKPVLQFHADGWPGLADNWQRGLALRVRSGADLVDKLELLQYERERSVLVAEQQRLKAHLFANLGHAIEVTAKYICEACAC